MSWRWLTRNFGWKVLALTFSLALWLAIVGAPELATSRAVPVLYKNLPRDLLIGQGAADAVHVELRGSSGRLTGENLADLAVLLDLSGVNGPGERTFTLSDGDFHLPEGVTLLRTIPSQLQVRFARKKSKEVPVEVRFASEPPPGYRVISQEVTPAKLQIAGPEARVDAIVAAQTDGIDLRNATGPMEVRVNTFVADPAVWLESSPVVRVKLKIERRQN